MKSLVIRAFIDKESKRGYSIGNVYESNDSERIAFLINKGFLEGTHNDESSSEDTENNDNESPEIEFPKHVGGGYYELSNGEKVKGKEEAFASEKELQEKVGE